MIIFGIFMGLLAIIMFYNLIIAIYLTIKDEITYYKDKKFRTDNKMQQLQYQRLSQLSNEQYDDLLKQSNDLTRFGSNAKVYFPVRGII